MAAPYGDPSAMSATSEPRWGLGDAVMGWLVAYALLIVTMGVTAAAMGLGDGDARTIAFVAITTPALWLGFIGVPIWAAATKGNGWIADFHVRIKAIDFPLGLVAGVASQLILVPLVSLPALKLAGKTISDLEKPARELAETASGLPGEILFVLVVGIGAPIAEEIFFRGLVFRSFEKRFGQWWALGLSSVVFGATHFQPLQFPALVMAGLVFGGLVVATGRLGPAIVAHMAFNFTTAVALVWL